MPDKMVYSLFGPEVESCSAGCDNDQAQQEKLLKASPHIIQDRSEIQDPGICFSTVMLVSHNILHIHNVLYFR